MSVAAFTVLVALLLSVRSARGQRTWQVSGTVVDASGAVIPGTSVTLFSDERVFTVKSDLYGRFDFQNLPEGAANLEVSSPGFRTVTKPNVQPGERGLFEVILEPGSCPQCLTVTTLCRSVLPMMPILAPTVSYEERPDDVSVAGNVRDALAGPLNEATVTLVNSANRSQYIASTNEKGEFQFRDIEPGKYYLKATRENYSQESAVFWVARENLTRIDRVYLLPAEKYRKICVPDVETESSVIPNELIPPQ